MGANRFHFADENDRAPPPASFWLTRAIIVSILVGLGGAVHIILGLF